MPCRILPYSFTCVIYTFFGFFGSGEFRKRHSMADSPRINKKMLLIKVSDEKLREVCPNYRKRMREGKPVIGAQRR